MKCVVAGRCCLTFTSGWLVGCWTEQWQLKPLDLLLLWKVLALVLVTCTYFLVTCNDNHIGYSTVLVGTLIMPQVPCRKLCAVVSGPWNEFWGQPSIHAHKDWGCCWRDPSRKLPTLCWQRERHTGGSYKDECALEYVSLSHQLGSSQHSPELPHEQARVNSEAVWPQGSGQGWSRKLWNTMKFAVNK